jgi:hypothetical protein
MSELSGTKLPMLVQEAPHWRVNFRPNEYQEHLIPALGKCLEVIEKTKLSLRGWDYPHLSNRPTELGYGENWIASWSDFMGHREYWRFYQSGQFLHLFSVREVTAPGWRQKLEAEMKSHLFYMDYIDWGKVPGFIALINLLYSMTEIFEFGARLSQSGIYSGLISIRVEIKRIKGFVLSADWDRSWHNYYAASEDNLGHTWTIESSDLVANSAEYSLNAAVWFFERFGWLSPSLEVLRRDQENFLKGRI